MTASHGMRPVANALVIFGLALALVPQAAPAAEPTQADSQRALNETLRGRISALEQVLAGDPCTDPTAAAQLAPLPPPLTGQDASVQGDPSLTKAQLAQRLHQSVVMVLAGRQTGSGFFVTPDTVVTNDHVISESPDKVLIVGNGTGGIREAKVLVHTGQGRSDGRDYAVLKVAGPATGAPLPLTRQVGDLADVVAAGYPGVLLDNDMSFKALAKGDGGAIPELAFSRGTVMAVQNRGRGIETIAHSAPISAGNSGGPLVDGCGRVTGINTFVNVAVQQARSAGFALGSSDLAAYLAEAGVAARMHDGTCGGGS